MNKIIKIALIASIVALLLTVGVKAATSIAASQITYNGTTVQAKLDELVNKASNIDKIVETVTCTPGHYCTTSTSCPSGALCSKVKLGDYVSMTPTSTSYKIPAGTIGYTSDQTINPSELNLWRVIDIRDDGTVEMVSEYVSSGKVYFNGQKGYLNFVGTLNTIAKQYENSKYTVGSRYIGFNGQTQVITDTSTFVNPPLLTSSTSDNSNEKIGGGDVMYEYDTNTSTGKVYKALGTLVAKKVGTTTASTYWLSVRNYNYRSSTDYRWNVRSVDTLGDLSDYGLYFYNYGFYGNSGVRALRPIVTLKADVQATGSGTSRAPWVLS